MFYLVFALFLAAAAGQRGLATTDLDASTFALSCVISQRSTIGNQLKPNQTRFDVFHSPQRIRINLELERRNRTSRGQIYRDNQANVTLIKFDGSDCKQALASDVDRLLLLPKIDMNGFIGIIKLLKLIKLRLPEAEIIKETPTLRVFKLALKLADKEKTNSWLFVSYVRADTRLPFEIDIMRAEELISISLFGFRLLLDGDESFGWRPLGKFGQLDPFAIEPQICSQALEASNSKQLLFSNIQQPDQRVEFSFEFGLAGAERQANWVAYDGSLGSLRVDQATDCERLETSKQLVNFAVGRRYQAFERHYERAEWAESQFSQLAGLEPDQDRPSELTRCSISKVDSWPSSQATLGELLAGADGWTLLGRGRVRGLDTLVYEASDVSLPYWLDLPLAMDTRTLARSIVLQVVGGIRSTKPVPVLLEIMLANDESISLEIFKFIWNIPSHLRSVDPFSLNAGFCLNASEPMMAQGELLLDQAADLDDTRAGSLKWTLERNRQLLASLQRDLEVPATLLGELGSRLLASQSHHGLAMEVSFKISDHHEPLAQFRYLEAASHAQGNNIRQLYAKSLSLCAGLASLRRMATYFGYMASSQSCFVNFEQATGRAGEPTGFTGRATRRREIQVFLVNFEPDYKHENFTSFIQQLGLPNPNSQLRLWVDQSDGHSPQHWRSIAFAIKKFDLHLLVDCGQDVGSLKFAGLGMETSEPRPRIVVARPDLCHAKCLGDIDCKSYSICLRKFELECQMSSVMDLHQAQVAQQVANFNDNTTMKRLQLDQVSLVRESRCDLFAKRHMDLFQRTPEPRSLANSGKQEARDLEHCAMLCFACNVDILRKQVESGSAEIVATPSRQDASCLGFGFQSSWCFLFWAKSSDQTAKTSDGQVVDFYAFKFESFFEIQHGMRLLRSEMPADIEQTYKQLIGNPGGLIGDSQMAKLRAYARSGANLQAAAYLEAGECARRCFLQDASNQLWPGCRSFAVVRAAHQVTPMCLLNSMTFSDLLQGANTSTSLLIEDHATNHFEPRAGLVAQASLINLEDELNGKSKPQQVPGWPVWLGLGAVLSLGCWLGVAAAPQLVHLLEGSLGLQNRQLVASQFGGDQIELWPPKPELQRTPDAINEEPSDV